MIMELEFSREFEISKLSDGESELKIEATPDEMDQLAKRFNLAEIKSLSATLHLKIDPKKETIHLEGHLDTDIVQTCVVTLNPLPVKISAPFVRNFMTTQAIQDSLDDIPAEIDLSEIDDNEPEPIEGGIIDFGEVTAEQLGLEIDPFPRTPGSEFAGFSDDSGENGQSEGKTADSSNPFAVLAQLKDPPQNKQ